MTTKRFVNDVPVTRHDARGKLLEECSLSVMAMDGYVELVIDGERRTKYYNLSRADWNVIRQI